MKFHLYQILVACVALFMILQGTIRYFKGTAYQTLLKLLIRYLVWGGMALIALFPTFTYWLAKFIGLEGNINAVILVGFILIFLIIFKLISAIERIEQQITEVTRKESLKNLNQDQ